MFDNTNFGKSVELLQRTMDVSMLRREVLTDNLANADTPNFKRANINFETELKKAIESESYSPKVELAQTSSSHFTNRRVKNWQDVNPRKSLDYLSQSDNSGNNVDLEEEMMLLMQNQLRYDILTRAISHQFTQVNMVLR